MPIPKPLYGKTLPQLRALVLEHGQRPYAADQLASWIYPKGAATLESMHNLPHAFRTTLAETHTVQPRPPLSVTVSRDGTRKYLFPAGESAFVEAAFIPEGRRATLCLSVQVGCKMGCRFCMTARQGFRGNLDPADIVNQYRALPERGRVTNIVYMGMGEPLDNLESVLASLEILTAAWGYALSPTRITVSTVGLLPALETFLDRTSVHLAISLHTPFEEERASLMPVQTVYPLRGILEALRRRAWKRQRRVSFEYIAFDGLNDTRRHAAQLCRLLQGIPGRVNLIPFHPLPGSPFAPSPPASIERFQTWLKEKGIRTTIRQSRGLDIAAACGLLSTREWMRAGSRLNQP